MWTLCGVDVDEVDGIPTAQGRQPPAEPAEHPNGVVSIDHLVMTTPDMDRTVAALEAVGMVARRTRRDERLERPRLQTFFRLGEPILEVIGPAEPRGDGPARLFGLAYTVADLATTAGYLGEGLGGISDAVQEGRRIATLRHEALGLSVATAFMSPEPRPLTTSPAAHGAGLHHAGVDPPQPQLLACGRIDESHCLLPIAAGELGAAVVRRLGDLHDRLPRRRRMPGGCSCRTGPDRRRAGRLRGAIVSDARPPAGRRVRS